MIDLFAAWIRDSFGRDVGIVGENREVSYSCRVDPSFIGCSLLKFSSE
jgi:hypothetical protein